MKKKSLLLKEQRGQKVAEMRGVIQKAKDETRELTAEEQKRNDEIEAEITSLDEQIAVAEKQERQEALIMGPTGNGNDPLSPSDTKASRSASILTILRAQLDGKALNGVEAEVVSEFQKEQRSMGLEQSNGFGIPSWAIQARGLTEKRDMTVGSGSAGGYYVPTEIAEPIPYLMPRLATMELGATMMSGLTASVDMPRNGVATAVWEGETDAAAESTPTIGRIQLTPNRLGTYVDVSRQLLLQTGGNIEALVRQMLSQAIAIKLDATGINGSGSGEPYGILNYSGVNNANFGAGGGVPTWAKITELEGDVDASNALQNRLGYLTSPAMRTLLKTITKDSGSGQFLVNGNDCNGYQIVSSSQVPTTLDVGGGGGNVGHGIIFGNWAELVYAQFGGLDLVVDPYSQAANALVRIHAFSWWDIDLFNAGSFSIINNAKLS